MSIYYILTSQRECVYIEYLCVAL